MPLEAASPQSLRLNPLGDKRTCFPVAKQAYLVACRSNGRSHGIRMKMERPGHLPDFDAPPLTEVAVSVQFRPIANFTFVDIGPLWERFRDRFAHVQYHPRLMPNFETFGLPPGVPQPFQINLGPIPEVPRTWFIDSGGNEVLQFQSDRLVHNWRKIEVNSVYPRYERIRERFSLEFAEIEGFLTDRGLGPIVLNQCELTYINLILVPESPGEPASKVFKHWARSQNPRLGEAEDVAFTARFLMKDDTGHPKGRVIAQASPGLDMEGRAIIQLTLVARGAPKEPTLGSALEFIDTARDYIVCGFAELTSEEMHEVWKKRKD